MSTYRLLRSNKESGPYTLDEIVALGFKPYDLVWVEGRSASWRYPSECTELQPFAPAVEEQPYDRFYKKPADKAKPAQAVQPAIQKSNSEIAAVSNMPAPAPPVEKAVEIKEPEIPVVKEVPKIIIVPSKKVYITLPAGNNSTIVVKEEKKLVKEVMDSSKGSASPTTSPVIPLSKTTTPEIKEEPVIPPQRFSQKLAAHTNYPVSGERPNKENYFSRFSIPIRGRKQNSSLLIAISAVCILLGGVVIGMFISRSGNQDQRKELDKLVQQIKEKEKNNARPAENSTNANQADLGIIHTSNPIANDQPSQEVTDQKAPVEKKQKASASGKKQTVTAPGNTLENQQATREPETQPVTEPEKPMINAQALEEARKKIYEMVSVGDEGYKTGVLGGISDLKLTVSNNSHYALDEVEVVINYLGPEKRVVRKHSVFFNDVAPGEQKTIQVPKSKRGVSITYSVTKISSKTLGIASVGY